MITQLWKSMDNRKTYTLCALWLLAWWAEQNGFITQDLYMKIFGQTGPVFPTVIAAIRSAIGESK